MDFNKENFLSILYFLGAVFVFVLIVGFFIESSINPFFLAIYVTGFFTAFFAIVGTVVYIVNGASLKFIQLSKLSKEDFKFQPDLYRDIIEKYSPALLFFIDNMQYDYKYSIIANLLSLKNKKYIEFDKDKINIIKYGFYNLELSEKYVIENIRNGKVQISKKNLEFKELIIEEGKRKKLFEEKEKGINVFLRSFFKFGFVIFLLVIVLFILANRVINKELDSYTLNAIIKIGGIVFLIAWMFICFYVANSHANPYLRTKESEKINKKLEGLKKYINDYSKLGEKESKDIVLWEDYLIYSVIFKQNKKIINEYRKYLY